jgi:hypothetical protein
LTHPGNCWNISDVKGLIHGLVVLVLLAAPAAVQAQFEYIVNSNNTVTITGYTGTGGAVIIPAITNGLTVTTIGQLAFEEKSSITSVSIPGTVTSIEDDAFILCENLTSVTAANGLTTIGLGAFLQCYALTSVTIPGTVSTIGYEAFGGAIGGSVARPASATLHPQIQPGTMAALRPENPPRRPNRAGAAPRPRFHAPHSS